MATIREYLDKMSTVQLIHLIPMHALGHFDLSGNTVALICEILAGRSSPKYESCKSADGPSAIG